MVESNPDHIFVLLDEGTILTNNDTYVKNYLSNPPSLSLRSQLLGLYSEVGLNTKDPLRVFNKSQY